MEECWKIKEYSWSVAFYSLFLLLYIPSWFL